MQIRIRIKFSCRIRIRIQVIILHFNSEKQIYFNICKNAFLDIFFSWKTKILFKMEQPKKKVFRITTWIKRKKSRKMHEKKFLVSFIRTSIKSVRIRNPDMWFCGVPSVPYRLKQNEDFCRIIQIGVTSRT
jgi:hypothetical protein